MLWSYIEIKEIEEEEECDSGGNIRTPNCG